MEEIEILHEEYKRKVSIFYSDVQLSRKCLERKLLKLAKEGKLQEVKNFVESHTDIFYPKCTMHEKLENINKIQEEQSGI